ncbi:hypothetical protein HDE_07874 [Halotydeus destructor]|nr:hypothetical protein HDE_07874 [Halotydeus destructor]
MVACNGDPVVGYPDKMAASVTSNSTREARLGIPRPFGSVTRDQWLAKEYFGYLCAPSECILSEEKVRMRETCFSPHDKLQLVLQNCFEQDLSCSEAVEDKAMNCVLMASKNDPQLIPISLHDCIDDKVSMKQWKCIRRHFMDRMKTMMDNLRGKALDDVALHRNATGA